MTASSSQPNLQQPGNLGRCSLQTDRQAGRRAGAGRPFPRQVKPTPRLLLAETGQVPHFGLLHSFLSAFIITHPFSLTLNQTALHNPT